MYLLDTHVLLWWLMDDSRLSNRARAILKDPECLIWVSAASIWEIFIKKNLGKLDVTSELEEVIDASGFKQLSISFEHAKLAGQLPKHHQDPFDRMLIAQTSLENLKLITSDVHFKRYGISTII